MWAGQGAAHHPALAAEVQVPLEVSVLCCIICDFLSPLASLTIILSKEKAKKEKERERKGQGGKKPTQAKMLVLALQWG